MAKLVESAIRSGSRCTIQRDGTREKELGRKKEKSHVCRRKACSHGRAFTVSSLRWRAPILLDEYFYFIFLLIYFYPSSQWRGPIDFSDNRQENCHCKHTGNSMNIARMILFWFESLVDESRLRLISGSEKWVSSSGTAIDWSFKKTEAARIWGSEGRSCCW